MSRRSKAAKSREASRIALAYEPTARERFPELRDRLLASRPIIGSRVSKHSIRAARISRGIKRVEADPIYGKPTFRNVINEAGEHV